MRGETQRHAAIVTLALSALLAGAGCSRCSGTQAPAPTEAAIPEEAIPVPAKNGPPLSHASGLTLLPQPSAIVVRETPEGFRAQPENARRVRNPWSAELRLVAADPLPPAGTTTKRVGEHAARYALSVDDEAGSGGPLHTLAASAACASGYITLTASQQVEPPAQPDWTPAWTLLAASGCADKAEAPAP